MLYSVHDTDKVMRPNLTWFKQFNSLKCNLFDLNLTYDVDELDEVCLEWKLISHR